MDVLFASPANDAFPFYKAKRRNEVFVAATRERFVRASAGVTFPPRGVKRGLRGR